MTELTKVAVGTVTLHDGRIKTIKADLVNEQVTIAFTFRLCELSDALRHHLQYLVAADDALVDLGIVQTIRQLTFAEADTPVELAAQVADELEAAQGVDNDQDIFKQTNDLLAKHDEDDADAARD